MKTSELTGAALDWVVAEIEGLLHDDGTVSDYWQPSELWEQGGPIIERERISWADYGKFFKAGDYKGPTPLIAAMRCYIASKLGDNVDIPKELT